MDRSSLQTLLESLLGSDHVYFQPPASVGMVYPCIVYHRDSVGTIFADNAPFRTTWRYEVMVIARDPDTDIPDKFLQLPMCVLSRTFVADNLNHYVFSLYY